MKNHKQLIKNSRSCALSCIEIYNKINLPYKDFSVLLLLINSWELALKALIWNKLGKNKIFLARDKTKTISISDCLKKINEFNSNDIKLKNFLLNIESINVTRNNIQHFNLKEEKDIQPIIEMLLHKSILNLNIFFKEYLNEKEGLLKEQYLPMNLNISYENSVDTLKDGSYNIKSLLKALEAIETQTNNDSIYLKINIKFESTKRNSDVDYIVGIDSQNSSNLPSITKISEPSQEWIKQNYPIKYSDLKKNVKKTLTTKFNEKKFNNIMNKEIKINKKYSYCFFNPLSNKPTKQYCYNSEAINFITKQHDAIDE